MQGAQVRALARDLDPTRMSQLRVRMPQPRSPPVATKTQRNQTINIKKKKNTKPHIPGEAAGALLQTLPRAALQGHQGIRTKGERKRKPNKEEATQQTKSFIQLPHNLFVASSY